MAHSLNTSSAVLIFSLVVGGFASVLPKGGERCKLSDPSLDACLKKAAQKFLPLLLNGIPEIGIPKMEPFTLPDIYNDDPVLNFRFINNSIYGTPATKIEELKINQIKRKITLVVQSSGHMDSHYIANGRLLIFPIVGEGDSHIIMNGVRYTYKLNYNITKGEDGKEYWKIYKYKATYETPKYANYQFTNLFNGNKELADTLLRFTNENWKEIFGLVGKAPMKAVTDSVVEHLTIFFAKIPTEDLFES